MEAETGTVERDRFDTESLRALGDPPPDRGRGSLVAAIRNILAHVGFERRRACQYRVAGRRDDLRVDVAIRPAHDQSRRALLGNAHPGFAGAADSSLSLVHQISPITSSSFP